MSAAICLCEHLSFILYLRASALAAWSLRCIRPLLEHNFLRNYTTLSVRLDRKNAQVATNHEKSLNDPGGEEQEALEGLVASHIEGTRHTVDPGTSPVEANNSFWYESKSGPTFLHRKSPLWFRLNKNAQRYRQLMQQSQQHRM